jgi:hypothetical protein
VIQAGISSDGHWEGLKRRIGEGRYLTSNQRYKEEFRNGAAAGQEKNEFFVELARGNSCDNTTFV